MINIIICDACANSIKLCEELIYRCSSVRIVAKAKNKDALLSLMKKYIEADIIVYDIYMPFTNGLSLLKTITKEYPEYKILMNSIIDDLDTIKLVIGFGAAGFLSKKEMLTMLLEEAITNVHLEGYHYPSSLDAAFIEEAKKNKPKLPETGIFSLTAQEEAVFKLLPTDKTNKEIAEILGIKKRTVDTHCINIYHKLGVTTRAGAIEVGSFKKHTVQNDY